MNSTVPKYCYFQKGRWVYVPYIDKKRGKEIPLKFNGKLIRKDDPMSRIWTAYEKLVNNPSDTLSWLIDDYMESVKFKKLTPRTKKDYTTSANDLKTKELKSGQLFGEISYEKITPSVITKLYDSMIDTPTAAKHRGQFLQAVYSWGYARDICKKNPVKSVPKPSTKDKTDGKEYVEDADYYYSLSVARELKNYLYPMMIIAYCCRARVGEISRKEIVVGKALKSGIRQNDITDEGIFIYRSKGSLPEVTLWSDFLREGHRAAVEYSQKQDSKSNVHQQIKEPYLIHDRSGNPISKNSFDSAWRRLIDKCKKNNKDFKRFSIHELKAKGIDDHKNQESGHKTESAKAIYLRKIKRTESTK